MTSSGNLLILVIVIILQIYMLTPSNGEIIINENSNQLEKYFIAIRDIGYFLRNHKFNEYDRRNHNKKQGLFIEFPKPVLYQLHPEVKKFCGDGKFRTCLQYLHGVSQTTSLQRSEDTSTLIVTEKWKSPENESQISAADINCRRLQKQDDQFLDPSSAFQGPLERFQWRSSASYYMCWFTMLRRPLLEHFGEPCDNFASCLDVKYGAQNKDPRANDSVPFSCAQYSFCPDPCCGLKHVDDMHTCFVSPLNPCHAAHANTLHTQHGSITITVNLHKRTVEVPKKKAVAPTCSLPVEKNQHLASLMLNHWNLTCPCPDEGYEWDSRFNSCVDIDECSHGDDLTESITKPCGGPQVSACFNLPGGATCVCRWGFTNQTGRCVPDKHFHVILDQFLNP